MCYDVFGLFFSYPPSFHKHPNTSLIYYVISSFVFVLRSVLQKGSQNGSDNRPKNGAATDKSNGLSETAAMVLDEALASLQPALRDKNGIWTADYVRLRFKAHLPDDCTAGTAVDNGRAGGTDAG